tara:strand:- start:55 stop:498 length:444 start_codon:yes stop_codon:yes gene_type:complete
MKYNQTVKIKNVDFKIVNQAFHSINFVNFLTSFQPVKIINWSGVKDGDEAYFKLWFFGWKDFKVKHEKYNVSEMKLSFIDRGIKLPLGIDSWEHTHIVKMDKEHTIIKDKVCFTHSNKFLSYLLFPILIFPIFIRKLLYKVYFIKLH